MREEIPSREPTQTDKGFFLLRDVLNSSDMSHNFDGVSYKVVSMDYVYGAYVVLGSGYLLALTLCFMEMGTGGRRIQTKCC